MKKGMRATAFGLGVVLIGLQFYRSPRNDGVAEGPSSLFAQQTVPTPVKQILQRACYDCHSNHTVYPWYGSVQPVAWWVSQHIEDGKHDLNFSEFAGYDTKRATRKLRAISDEVGGHSMPLKSYLLMHREARLTDAERALVANWAEDLADDLGGK